MIEEDFMALGAYLLGLLLTMKLGRRFDLPWWTIVFWPIWWVFWALEVD